MATSHALRGYLAFVVFLAFAPIATSAQLSLPVVSTGPGSTVLVSAFLAPGADSVSGLQFDLHYDGAAVSLVATAGETVRAAGKSIYYQDLTPNDRRFVVIGLNQNLIPEGALINLFVILNANALSGVHVLGFSNLVSTDPAGQVVLTTGLDGSINVGGAAGSTLQSNGILNAASLESGSVAPGELITLIGSGIGPAISLQAASSDTSTLMGSISVLFDEKPAPLLYVSPNQINAIVPYGISGQDVTQVSITRGGQEIAGLSLPASTASPAIFTLDASGVGAAAILNQDSTLNSPLNPAAPGSIVMMFANGGGQTDPPGVDGQITFGVLPRPELPVSVQIDGMDAEVLYAGAAPGLVAGVLQVNSRLPEKVRSGSVPITLRIGSASSPLGVMLAIR